MAAFPPVAVLLVKTAPALQPRAELIPPFARFLRLGIIARTTFALRIHSEPTLNQRRLGVGRGGEAENEAQRGDCERERHDDPQTRR